MTNKKIIIRVDGNSKIGLGHIYRGIALAEMLKLNYEILFLIRENSSSIAISHAGFTCINIPETMNLEEESNYIFENFSHANAIVLDGYDFGEAYQTAIRDLGFPVIYIDDLRIGIQKSDLVINHCPGIVKEQYITASYTELAIGLSYSLIRPSFANFNRKGVQPRNGIKNVLISFGGADPLDFTFKALDHLVKESEWDIFDVIIGGAYPHKKIFKLTDNRIRFHKNLSEIEIFEVMKSTDIAITPASTTSIELASLGVPMVLGYFVDNQKGIYDGFINHTSVIGVGDFNNFTFGELATIIKQNATVVDKIQASLLTMFEGEIKANILQKFQTIC